MSYFNLSVCPTYLSQRTYVPQLGENIASLERMEGGD